MEHSAFIRRFAEPMLEIAASVLFAVEPLACEDRKQSPSEFANLFDLEQREPVAHSFLSSDCNSFGSVVSEFGVHWLGLAHQQIGLTVLTFYPDRQALSNARFSAFSVLRTAQIVGDVAGHIQHFALDDDLSPLHGWMLDNDFLPLHKLMSSALRQIEPNRGYAGQDNYRGCKLHNVRPASTKWNRPFAYNLLSEITRRLNFTKFRSDGAVRSALLAHPFRKVRIAASMRQCFLELGIGVINWPA